MIRRSRNNLLRVYFTTGINKIYRGLQVGGHVESVHVEQELDDEEAGPGPTPCAEKMDITRFKFFDWQSWQLKPSISSLSIIKNSFLFPQF